MSASTQAAVHGITVARSNRVAILETLCHSGPISRSQLAELTGIALPTVHRLCAQLKEEGFIEELGEHKDGRGRPMQILSFNSSYHAMVTINVRGSQIDGALMGLNGKTLFQVSSKYGQDSRVDQDQNSYVQSIVAMISFLQAQAQKMSIPCSGIGIGIPGVVNGDGMVYAANELHWSQVPLLSILQTSFSDDILIENNANAFAYGESLVGAGKGCDPVVGYTIRHFGVGAGIISKGTILRGRHGSAGEMGYTLTSTDSLRKYYTSGGDLEQQISLLSQDPKQLQDPQTRGQLFDLIALSMSNLCLLIDPQIIVIDASGTLPKQEIADAVSKRLVGRIPNVPHIVPTQLEQEAPLVGIGELIAQKMRTQLFNE
ncbi:hypothetical protein KIM372_00890 [Bombiscardovia nodaiensis]|uniref:ROK family transcriptional regulator n=1 Tax=Bombiscardovia nodaiensis TaxID=2932181 RepID=A0ABN6S7P3_9BIFI|nr:hypothetical protein KIM372_00890 [Bombiscardovia nodaiensis]